jgi:hypothetical protein
MILAVVYVLWSYLTFFKGKPYELIIRAAAAVALFTFAYNLISHNVFLLFGGK